MKLLLGSALMGLVAAAPSELEAQQQFVSFMKAHNKTYASKDMFTRFNVFKDNLAVIEKHNSGSHSWTLGVTPFADLTQEEFKAQYLPGFPKEVLEEIRKRRPVNGTEPEEVTSPQAALDWRTSGAVSAIRNQGQCGSCWAFAAVSAIESAYKIKKGTLKAMSEQNLVDCDKTDFGCDGGFPFRAYEWAEKNGGLASRSAYPYTQTAGQCYTGRTKVSFTMNGHSDTSFGSETGLMSSTDIGPVAVGIQSNPYMNLYTGGVYSGACGRDLDHAVVVVGYGSTSGGTPYWTVRNSWGTSWGESGYFRLVRNKDQCGIADLASRPIVV